MFEESDKSPAESQNVLEFIRVGWEYILYMEKEEERESKEVMDFVQKLAPLLYLKATLLPELEPEHPEALERFVTEEEWESLFNSLRNTFGDDDIFWFVDPDVSEDYEPVKASLAEHLTDIYQDLKDFIMLYRKNSEAIRETAVSDIVRLFKTRWGPELLRVQVCLHQSMFPAGEDETYMGIVD